MESTRQSALSGLLSSFVNTFLYLMKTYLLTAVLALLGLHTAAAQQAAQQAAPGAAAKATGGKGSLLLLRMLQQPKADDNETERCLRSCVKTLVAFGARTDAALHTEHLLRHDMDTVLVGMLKRNELTVNDTDAEGRTLLMRAAAASAFHSLRYMLGCDGADFSLRDRQGRLLLHYMMASPYIRLCLLERGNSEIWNQLAGKNGEFVNARDAQGRTPLLVLAETPDLDDAFDGRWVNNIAERLIKRGADVNAADAAGRTPLSVAESRGLAALHRYLQAQLDPQTAQWRACAACLHKGDAEGLRKLLEAGVNADVTDANGCTLLQYLLVGGTDAEYYFDFFAFGAGPDLSDVYDKYEEAKRLPSEHLSACLEVLLNAGADANASRNGMLPPLMLSIGCADTAVMRRLLAAGANANVAVESKYDGPLFTPLYIVASRPAFGEAPQLQWEEKLKLLLEAGADVNAKDCAPAESPLAEAARRACLEDESGTALSILRLMLDRHPRQETLNAALLRCAGEDNTAVMQCLLDAGADINARDESGNTLLHHLAAYTRSASSVQWVLSHGADIEARGREGITPWLRAMFGSPSVSTLRLLVQAGADVWARDEIGDSAWGKTRNAECTEDPVPEWVPYVKQVMAEARVKAGLPAEESPAEAIEYGDTESLRWHLADGGCDVNARDAQGRTLLMAAVSYGGSEVQKGDTEPCERCGGIHGSIRRARRADMVRLLLAAGAEVGATDAEGRTAADWAVAAGEQPHSPVLQLLQADAARTDAAVNARLTECLLCITKGDTEGLKQKLQGLDVNAPNRIGLRLLDLACRMAVVGTYSPAAAEEGVPALSHFVKSWGKLLMADGEVNEARRRRGAESLRVLLAAGADPNLAEKGKSPAATELLFHGDAETVSMLLAAGLNIHTTFRNGMSLITAACGNRAVLELLLAHSPTQQELNDALVDLAGIAVYYEPQLEMVLAAGAEINGTDSKGRTALTVAAEELHEAQIEYLLAKGADAAVPNSEGKTAADILRRKIEELSKAAADAPQSRTDARDSEKAQRLLQRLEKEV